MKENKFKFFIPTQYIFGCGELQKLAKMPLPGKKALIVISSGASMKKFGYLEKVERLLQEGGVETEVFDKILPNPTKMHVMQGAQLCKDSGCDFVVGLGGGSSIDSAKSIAMMAKNEGDYWDYVVGGTAKGNPVTKGALPIVAIPTTAGTGTEVDPWTVITDTELNEKIGFGCAALYPTISIVDPELMMSIPADLTAYQGFDAFFHATEGYLASIASPISDMYALEAIRLLYKYLPVAVHDPRNVKARAKVAWASSLAGMVESTSCCISEHSMEHAMSAYYPKLPHGAGLIAISKEYYKTFKNDKMKRYMKMADAMTGRKSARPGDFIDALEIMQRECGVDTIRLSEYGITPMDFPRFADNALSTCGNLFDLDPRMLTREDIIAIYANSWK